MKAVPVADSPAPHYGVAMKSATVALLGLLGASMLATIPASAAIGNWGHGQRSEVRLLAAGVGKDGRLTAGIEIVLPRGWRTYWRTPGDAGVPPVIDFSASKNLGPADVAFPLPTREDEGDDIVDNIYLDRVTLPVSATIADPKKPVELSLRIHLGVCDKVCVPEDVTVALTVPPNENDMAATATIAAAVALVPGPPEPGKFALDKVTRDGGTDGHPVFRFEGVVPDAANAHMFIEGPEDWFPYTPAFVHGGDGKAAYTVEFSRLGSPVPIAGARFRVTIASGGRAIDQTLPLD